MLPSAVHRHRRHGSPHPQKTFKKFSMLSIFKNLGQLFTYDIGIDLGTANTLVYIKDQGIVLREPSVVAMQGDQVKAVGEEAKRMVGRTPGSVVAIRPLKEGVIADFVVAHQMLNYFIKKARQRRSLRGPRVLIAHPPALRRWNGTPLKFPPTTPGPAACAWWRSPWLPRSAAACRSPNP